MMIHKINVEENKVHATVAVGPCFAVGIYRQHITTSTNNVEDYTTIQTIIMIPFVSLVIQKFKLPENKSLNRE